MKKSLIIFLIFISFKAFAIRAVNSDENDLYLKFLGLNSSQRTKLEKLNNEKHRNIALTIKKSKEYKLKNPYISTQEYKEHLNSELSKIEKDFEKKLDKILNASQKQKYLEYCSRFY